MQIIDRFIKVGIMAHHHAQQIRAGRILNIATSGVKVIRVPFSSLIVVTLIHMLRILHEYSILRVSPSQRKDCYVELSRQSINGFYTHTV